MCIDHDSPTKFWMIQKQGFRIVERPTAEEQEWDMVQMNCFFPYNNLAEPIPNFEEIAKLMI